jgi:hypothetical protein
MSTKPGATMRPRASIRWILPGVGLPVVAAGDGGVQVFGQIEPGEFRARDGELSLEARMDGWVIRPGERAARVAPFSFESPATIEGASCDELRLRIEPPAAPAALSMSTPLRVVFHRGPFGGMTEERLCAVAEASAAGASAAEIAHILRGEAGGGPPGDDDAGTMAKCIGANLLCVVLVAVPSFYQGCLDNVLEPERGSICDAC